MNISKKSELKIDDEAVFSVASKRIVYKAIMAFNKETGLTLSLDHAASGVVIHFEEFDYRYCAFVQNWAAHVDEDKMIASVLELDGLPLLIADYINPSMARRLKQRSISFIDTAANMFFSADALFIFVSGNKPKLKLISSDNPTGRAFMPAGLRLLYVMLTDVALVQHSYRALSKRTGIAVGSVGAIFKDLTAQGYLVGSDVNTVQGARKLRDVEGLMCQWAKTYSVVLRKRLLIARFRPPETFTRYDRIHFGGHACWGGDFIQGELAGTTDSYPSALYVTSDLKSTDQTFDELTSHGFISDKKGELIVYRAFWPCNSDGDLSLPTLVMLGDLYSDYDRHKSLIDPLVRRLMNQFSDSKFIS